jgi:hypothetical protein
VADDIVTRLRSTSLFPEWSDLAPDYGIGDDGEKLSVFVYGEQLLNEAADEIERLRAENVRLSSFLYPLGATIRYDGIKDMTSEQVDQILKVIRETHRG